MDTRGARHLAARLAAGAVGERVEITTVPDGALPNVLPGQVGTVVEIGEGAARVLLDSGAEILVDRETICVRRAR